MNSFVNWVSALRIKSFIEPNHNDSLLSKIDFLKLNKLDESILDGNKLHKNFQGVIHRVYNTFGLIVDQLNKLLHQHVVGFHDISTSNKFISLPPSSTIDYMNCLYEKFISESDHGFPKDTLDIHAKLITVLPKKVLRCVIQTYYELLKKTCLLDSEALCKSVHFNIVSTSFEDLDHSQWEKLWNLDFDIDVTALICENIGPLQLPILNYLVSYTTRNYGQKCSSYEPSKTAKMNLKYFISAICSCPPDVSDSQLSSSIANVPLFSSLQKSVPLRGRTFIKLDKRKTRVQLKRSNEGTMMQSFPPTVSSQISSIQSAFCFNPTLPSDTPMSVSGDEMMPSSSSYNDSFSSRLGTEKSLSSSDDSLLTEANSKLGCNTRKNVAPVEMEVLNSEFNFSSLGPGNRHGVNNSVVLCDDTDSRKSPTPQIDATSELSLHQLLQTYNEHFIQKMAAVFQVPLGDNNDLSPPEEVSVEKWNEWLLLWFGRLSTSVVASNKVDYLNWMEHTSSYDIHSLFLQAFKYLDTNQDKQLSEDDFCSSSDDSGVVGVESRDSPEVVISGNCDVDVIKSIPRRVDDDLINTISVVELFFDHHKVAVNN